MRHNIARNAADGGYTKKYVARSVAEVGRNSTAAILRATILGVDTRCNLAIARNIAPCVRTLRGVHSKCNHTGDEQNRTTAKWESDSLVTSMVETELDDTMSCYQLIISITISSNIKVSFQCCAA